MEEKMMQVELRRKSEVEACQAEYDRLRSECTMIQEEKRMF